MTELYGADELELVTDLDFLAAPLQALFGDVLERLKVSDYFTTEDGSSRTVSIVLAVREDIFVQLPAFSGSGPALGFGVIVDSEDEWPLIYCEIQTGGAQHSLSVQHFPLRIAIDNPYLRPVPIEGQAETVDAFSFEIEGGFTVASDLSVSASLDAFSVPPFEIVGSGLTLALDDCRLIVNADDVDSTLTDIGFDPAFRGIHAASALFDWDLPLQLDGRDLPGVHATLADIAIGNQGVSANVQLSWPVGYQDGDFDPTQTEMLGFLVDADWRCALAGLNLVITANVPNAIGASGHLRLPFLDAIFGLELFLSYVGEDDYQTRMALELGANEQIDFPLGHADYRVRISDLAISGRLAADEGLELHGETGCEISLPGLSVAAERADLLLHRDADGELFEFGLRQVQIDTLGTIDQASLAIETRRDDNGDAVLSSFALSAEVSWSELSSRIALDQLPDTFPLPPDDALVTLSVSWEDQQMQLSVEAGLTDVDRLWRFIPAAQRPEVAEAKIRIALTVQGTDFAGEAALAVRLRLPDAVLSGLSDMIGLGQLVAIDTGDEEGWIDAEFKADLEQTGNSGEGALSASLDAPVALAFNLPGLVLPQPPLVLSIDTLALELSGDDQQAEGEIRLGGSFALRPILPGDLGGLVPAPMALQLERLLAVAHLYDLVGDADMRLGVGAQGAYLALDCEFSNAGIEVDVFDMLAGVSAQLGASDDQGSEIDLDIEVSFALRELQLSIGRVPDSDQDTSDGIPFSFGLGATLEFAGQQTGLAFTLSSEALSFGFEELAIPLFIPQLPIAREDLDKLRDNAGNWDIAIWQQTIEPLIDEKLGEAEIALEAARDELEALPDDNEQLRFELQYRTIPSLQKDIFHFTGKKFLNEAILAIHQLLGQLSGSASQATYQGLVEVYQDAVDLTLGWVKFDSGLQFVISEAKFRLPFNDPSAIRVEGGASLKGFAPDSPLRPLADLEFRLGLSADAIYFAVEGGADPIPLPDLGRYPGSGVVLDRLAIGYGYSKNSLKVDFAGELLLSPQLVADLDTSRQLGAGVRLPTNNKLQFKLDLIPIVLGEVDFLLPLIAFDIDLRSDQPPGAANTACAPTWDGLQLHVPGVVRSDLKRAKFAPFFGPLPAPNYLYSFDIDIGNEQFGLTQVCDTYQLITPVMGTVPIPFLADSVPFFDRLCTNLRFAGFGINFELRRPFPHPSPLMIFELLGFLSDPSLPIDPAGHLADVMWAEIRNGRIALPPAVAGMFPEHGQVIDRELEARIDVGTVISYGQRLATVIKQLQTRLGEAGDDMADAIAALTNQPPRPGVTELLDWLPPELRRVELNGSFVGFEASAVLLLVSPGDLTSPPAPTPPPDEGPTQWQEVVHDKFNSNRLNGWRAVNHGLKRGQGDWTVKQGALVQNNNVGDNSAGRYGAMLIRETGTLSDIRVSVDMHSVDNDGLGIVFHVEGDTTFYRFRITAEQNEWQLMRLRRGRTKSLQVTQTAFVPETTYRVRIESRSVPQSGAALPVPAGRNVTAIDLADRQLGRRELERFSTHIRIWVNDTLWCDLVDNDNPLVEGEVGLDSWWNKGARFDNFVIEQARRGSGALASGTALALSRDLVPLTRRDLRPALPLAGGAAWAADDLAGFTDADRQAALSADGEPAVVVTARVQVLATQVFYRLLGVMRSDGAFRLLTSAGVAPLQLSVGGIPIPMSLQVEGRLLLEGRAAGAESWSRVTAALFGQWQLIPDGNGALAELRVGSATSPVALSLDSRGGFRVHGDGQLRLFNDQIVVDGGLDISQRHAAFHGELDFSPDLFISGQQRLMQLVLDVDGRLGPDRSFALAGGGELALFGQPFSAVTGRLTPDGVSLRARLEAGSGDWDINGFTLADAQLALQGEARFGAGGPAVALDGSGQFELNGMQVSGRSRVSAAPGDWCIGVAGQLHWQGRDWLQGAIELCHDRVTASGQTGFALDLTPGQLPGNIQIAGLYLSATVSGSFTMRASGRLKACAFDIDWTLAIRLPGGHALQAIPIASQQLRVDRANIASAASVTLADLITIDGWSLLPLQGTTIPVPTLTGDSIDLYLHDSIHVDPPDHTLPISLLSLTQPPGDPPPAPIGGLFGANIYSYQPTVNIPGFDVPLPVLSDEAPDDDPDADPLLSVPTIGIGDVEVGGNIELSELKLGLKLAWKDGELGIKVVQTGQFHPFASLPPLQLLFGKLLIST